MLIHPGGPRWVHLFFISAQRSAMTLLSLYLSALTVGLHGHTLLVCVLSSIHWSIRRIPSLIPPRWNWSQAAASKRQLSWLPLSSLRLPFFYYRVAAFNALQSTHKRPSRTTENSVGGLKKKGKSSETLFLIVIITAGSLCTYTSSTPKRIPFFFIFLLLFRLLSYLRWAESAAASLKYHAIYLFMIGTARQKLGKSSSAIIYVTRGSNAKSHRRES